MVGLFLTIGPVLSLPSVAETGPALTDSEAPIDLTKSKRGSCQPEELESGRGCVQAPKRTHEVWPKYPGRALGRKKDGTVSLTVTIDRGGTLRDVTVSSCTLKGFGFEEAALAAVRQWRYEPAVLKGETVSVIIQVMVEFFLPKRVATPDNRLWLAARRRSVVAWSANSLAPA